LHPEPQRYPDERATALAAQLSALAWPFSVVPLTAGGLMFSGSEHLMAQYASVGSCPKLPFIEPAWNVDLVPKVGAPWDASVPSDMNHDDFGVTPSAPERQS
jgi:hypothetical protein